MPNLKNGVPHGILYSKGGHLCISHLLAGLTTQEGLTMASVLSYVGKVSVPRVEKFVVKEELGGRGQDESGV